MAKRRMTALRPIGRIKRGASFNIARSHARVLEATGHAAYATAETKTLGTKRTGTKHQAIPAPSAKVEEPPPAPDNPIPPTQPSPAPEVIEPVREIGEKQHENEPAAEAKSPSLLHKPPAQEPARSGHPVGAVTRQKPKTTK